MTEKPRKIILMGMDGVMYCQLLKFVEEGKMPNVSYLIRNGTLGEACQEFPPKILGIPPPPSHAEGKILWEALDL